MIYIYTVYIATVFSFFHSSSSFALALLFGTLFIVSLKIMCVFIGCHLPWHLIKFLPLFSSSTLQVTLLEKRERFTRLNILHIWEWIFHDLTSLGATGADLHGKSYVHIGTRTLQARTRNMKNRRREWRSVKVEEKGRKNKRHISAIKAQWENISFAGSTEL